MTHGALRTLGPFQLLHGCEAGDNECWGPVGEYWVLYGSELRHLTFHAVAAAVLALALGFVLWRRGRARGWSRAALVAVAAMLVAAPLVFLALARAFPIHIVY